MSYRRGGPGTFPEQYDFPPATTGHKGLMPKLGVADAVLGGFTIAGGGGDGSTINPSAATTAAAGALSAADKATIDQLHFGPSGELLIPPGGVAGQDYLWRDSSGRVHLHGGFEVFIEASGALHLTANAYYDAASVTWNRVDIAKTAFLLVLRDNPTPQLEFYSVAAGANPITWVGPVNLTPALVTKLGALQDIRSLADPFRMAGTVFTMDILAPLALSGGDLGLSIVAPLVMSGSNLTVRDASAVQTGYLTAAHYSLLAGATSARTASAMAQRDASGDLVAGGWNSVNAAGGAAPAFSTNWSNKGGYNTVQYRLGIDKSVYLRGNCTKAAALVAGETIFTLPTGFRPPAQIGFRTFAANGATPVDALIVVTTAGLVQLYGGHTDNDGLSEVRFFLD